MTPHFVTSVLQPFFVGALVAFFGFLIAEPIAFALIRGGGLYVIVPERRCYVYVLFGNVIDQIDEPGLHFLLRRMGWKALLVNWVGKRYDVDLRLDQQYLRSQAVNSEEGAPMGIGIWYEMYISDPKAYLFRNADPRGSLAANVSNSTVRCLSNMPLASMLSNRHTMSQTVREEVSPMSNDWGYKLGSCYIRKVHFRDTGMIRQIESKVVNRLRQVTSAIKQNGANQVSIIGSSAEKAAAAEFARAAAIRPRIVGEALQRISEDAEVAEALFQIIETRQLIDGQATITLVPPGSGRTVLPDLLAAEPQPPAKPPTAPGSKPAQAPLPIPGSSAAPPKRA